MAIETRSGVAAGGFLFAIACCWLYVVTPMDAKMKGRVHVKTSSGAWVVVGKEDGVLRLGGNTSRPETFTLVPLAADLVKLLLERPLTLEARQADHTYAPHQQLTRSGCRCSGYSNAHGFGAYCAAWEEKYESRWCYVDDDCAGKSVKGGSFGRKHERCDNLRHKSRHLC